MNLFHLNNPEPPERLYAVVEVSRGSKNKYEYNFERGFLKLDRVSFTPFVSLADYGFVPETWTEDKSPLDVLVLTQEPLLPMAVVEVKPIGYLEVYAGGKEDPKIISVPYDDPRYNCYSDVEQLPQHFLKELSFFFSHYRKMERRRIEVKAVHGREEALKVVLKAIEEYKRKFS